VGDFPFEILAGFFELTHAFADATGKLGEFLGSEEKKNDEKNDDDLLSSKGSDECELVHKGVNGTYGRILSVATHIPDFVENKKGGVASAFL
jgi:hypothetical protein